MILAFAERLAAAFAYGWLEDFAAVAESHWHQKVVMNPY